MNKKFCPYLCLFCFAAAVLASPLRAAAPDLSKLPPPADKTGLTYEKDIRPLFEGSCFNCHGERRQRGGLRLDSLKAALQGGEDGPVILPGQSKESKLLVAVAQLDDETAMPPKRAPGGGPNGTGPRAGFGGRTFGPATIVAPQMFAQADRDHDKQLTRAEFSGLGDTWFEQFDTNQAGKLNQEQFTTKLAETLSPPQAGGAEPAPPGRQGRQSFNPARGIAPSLFAAADADKNSSLTREELKSTFEKWFEAWDSEKSGSISENQFRDGLSAALPRANANNGGFAGAGGGAGAGGMRAGPGMGGFGRGMLAQEMITQADQDKDKKLSKTELSALSETWFKQLDSDKAGKLSQEQFQQRLDRVLRSAPANDGPPPSPIVTRPGAGRGERTPGGGAGQTLGRGLFAATDTNKDGSLTPEEFKGTFEKWFNEWDAEKTGALNEQQLYAGLSSVIPREGGGGFGGPGGFGGADGGPDGGGGGSGPMPKALTAEQVGLVRAWIDQGAK